MAAAAGGDGCDAKQLGSPRGGVARAAHAAAHATAVAAAGATGTMDLMMVSPMVVRDDSDGGQGGGGRGDSGQGVGSVAGGGVAVEARAAAVSEAELAVATRQIAVSRRSLPSFFSVLGDGDSGVDGDGDGLNPDLGYQLGGW